MAGRDGGLDQDTGGAGPRRTFAFTFGLERLGLIALRAPRRAALAILLVSLLAAWGVSRLKVDDSLSELFRTDTPEFRQYEEVDRRFPSSEYDVLVVIEGPDLLKREQLDAVSRTIIDLNLTDGLKGLVSMLSARGKPDASGYAPPLVPEPLPEGAAYDAIIKSLRDNEVVKGKFLSADGTLALAVLALDRAAIEAQGAAAIIGGIQKSVDEGLKGSGLVGKLTGAPVMQLEIRNAVERDRLVYNGLGFLVGALIALLFFRRVSLMLIAVAGPAIAILWTLGLVGGLDVRLNLFMNALPQTYRRIHAILARAVQTLGPDATLAAPTPMSSLGSGACFASTAGGEVVVGGRKLIGSAQLRQGAAFLQHGSLLLEDNQETVALLSTGPTQTSHEITLREAARRSITFDEAATSIIVAFEQSGGTWHRLPATDIPQSHLPQFSAPAWTWRR